MIDVAKIRKGLSRFSDEAGATLIEYGVALIVVIIVGSVAIVSLADAVGTELSETANAF